MRVDCGLTVTQSYSVLRVNTHTLAVERTEADETAVAAVAQRGPNADGGGGGAVCVWV